MNLKVSRVVDKAFELLFRAFPVVFGLAVCNFAVWLLWEIWHWIS